MVTPRRTTIKPDVLAAFAALERRRDRHSDDYRDREHELMRRLNLVNEFWTMNSVLDRSPEPCLPETYAAHGDWQTCRAVRLQLLAALADPKPGPVAFGAKQTSIRRRCS